MQDIVILTMVFGESRSIPSGGQEVAGQKVGKEAPPSVAREREEKHHPSLAKERKKEYYPSVAEVREEESYLVWLVVR